MCGNVVHYRSHNIFPSVNTATKRSNLCYFVITIGYSSHLKTLFITYTINALSFLNIMSFQNITTILMFFCVTSHNVFAICYRLRTIWFEQKKGTWEWQQHKRLSKTLLTNQRPKGRKKDEHGRRGEDKMICHKLAKLCKNTVSPKKGSMASKQWYDVTYSMLIHPLW